MEPRYHSSSAQGRATLNPLLTFFWYRFYRVSADGGIPHVLVTKTRIYETGGSLNVALLSGYVLIETYGRSG